MTVFKLKRTGKWVAQVYDPVLGKKVQVGTRDTKGEARAIEREALARLPLSNMPVVEWWGMWLANTEWRESTRTHNRERTRAFVEAHGDMPLSKVDRRLARAWIDLHPSAHGALSAMFGAAQYEDDERGQPLLPVNPFSKLVKRTQARRALPSEWLTDADVDGLERAAVELNGPLWGPTLAGMIRFAAETGVRPGELFALRQDDIGDGVVRVARAADSKTRVITLPKNGREREVALSQRALAAAQSAMSFEGVDLLFPTPTGKQFWQPALSYYWRPTAAHAGRRGMAFYELRHYCATRLLEAGLDDRDVATALGHTDGGELVRRVYGHPSERRALDRVRDALDGEVAA